VESIEPSG